MYTEVYGSDIEDSEYSKYIEKEHLIISPILLKSHSLASIMISGNLKECDKILKENPKLLLLDEQYLCTCGCGGMTSLLTQFVNSNININILKFVCENNYITLKICCDILFNSLLFVNERTTDNSSELINRKKYIEYLIPFIHNTDKNMLNLYINNTDEYINLGMFDALLNSNSTERIEYKKNIFYKLIECDCDITKEYNHILSVEKNYQQISISKITVNKHIFEFVIQTLDPEFIDYCLKYNVFHYYIDVKHGYFGHNYILELTIFNISVSSLIALLSNTLPWSIMFCENALSVSPPAFIFTCKKAPITAERAHKAPTPASVTELGLPTSAIAFITSIES